MKLSLVIFIALISSQAHSTQLSSFETDYCTGFSEGPSAKKPRLWADCCLAHDMRYWFGGTKKQRKRADVILRQCVKRKSNQHWANLMYLGVTIGHASPIKHKHAWGWGWNDGVKFRNLTPQEWKLVARSLHQLDVPKHVLVQFLSDYDITFLKTL